MNKNIYGLSTVLVNIDFSENSRVSEVCDCVATPHGEAQLCALWLGQTVVDANFTVIVSSDSAGTLNSALKYQSGSDSVELNFNSSAGGIFVPQVWITQWLSYFRILSSVDQPTDATITCILKQIYQAPAR